MAARKSGFKNVQFDENLSPELFNETYTLITVLDVFYLIPYGEQEKILFTAAGALAPGGRLLLKEMSEQPRFKFIWNSLEEWVMVRLLNVIFGSGSYFRPRSDWETLLQRNGMSVQTIRMDHHYLHPHILFAGEKL